MDELRIKRTLTTSEIVDIYDRMHSGVTGAEMSRRMGLHNPSAANTVYTKIKEYLRAGLVRRGKPKTYLRAALIIKREARDAEEKLRESRRTTPEPEPTQTDIPEPFEEGPKEEESHEEPRAVSESDLARDLLQGYDAFARAFTAYIRHSQERDERLIALEQVAEAALGSNWRDMLRKKIRGEVAVVEGEK